MYINILLTESAVIMGKYQTRLLAVRIIFRLKNLIEIIQSMLVFIPQTNLIGSLKMLKALAGTVIGLGPLSI